MVDPLRSALTLLVVGVGTDDVHAALAADDLAILAAAADGWIDLHDVSFYFPGRARSGVAVDDAATIQIVGRHLDGDRIPGQDADVVHADLAGDVRQDLVSVGQHHLEARVGQAFPHLRLEPDVFFLGHVRTAFRSSWHRHRRYRQGRGIEPRGRRR